MIYLDLPLKNADFSITPTMAETFVLRKLEILHCFIPSPKGVLKHLYSASLI